MIKIKHGDIFSSECRTLVNPVNCAGVMGAGLALEFKRRYPDMFEHYKKKCKSGMRMGMVYRWKNREIGGRDVLLLPTKNHWREQSDIRAIAQSLIYFEEALRHGLYDAQDIGSIAFPKLGCGLGGLDWGKVKPLMVRTLTPVGKSIKVEIWE